jgi:futalosine hydrolase
MHILVIAATAAEVSPFLNHLEKAWRKTPEGFFEKEGTTMELNVTGVGVVPTMWGVAVSILRNKPDLAINAGIAGALDQSMELGSVYNVISECFGDTGIEQADGSFSTLFDGGLALPSQPPFQEGRLWNPGAKEMHFLPKVHGITVNKVHGNEESITSFRQQFPFAQVESMEGAAFYYGCLVAGVPFMELRSISNFVEKRNRANWNIPLAIQGLNDVLIEMLA